MPSRFARPCRSCGARVPAGGICPACGPTGSSRSSSCRMCGALTHAGAAYCSTCSAGAERVERQPWRRGYSDPVYARNRAARIVHAAGRCEDCGDPLAGAGECDHLVALRDGGTNLFTNLVIRCARCHRAKTAADRRRRRRGGQQ